MQREQDYGKELRYGRLMQLGRDPEPSKASFVDYKNV
jgi:hypothetical protein